MNDEHSVADVIGITMMLLAIAVSMITISIVIIDICVKDDFDGDIARYAQGELTIEQDCWGDKVFIVGDKELPYYVYYKLGLKGGIDCDDYVTRDTLIEGSDYTVYEKTFGLFNSYSYFIECN